MITTVLLILGAIFSVVAMVVFILSLATAPEGTEDETGFHYVKAKSVVRSRYFHAGSTTVRPHKLAKPFKTHIPAA